ncbi:MAG: PEP-CTERM sorting domain-containing protein [Phycisphaerales bacterium]|nr:PEP-CTERM sorting domain-containing protein [Phycisphaerales bacterium]
MTTLDVAALADLGWVVPEPAMLSMMVIGSTLLIAGRRRAA